MKLKSDNFKRNKIFGFGDSMDRWFLHEKYLHMKSMSLLKCNFD